MSDQSVSSKRPGRPPLNKPRNICVTISLPPELHEALKQLGGSRWVQQKIREAMPQTDETQEDHK